MDVPGPRSLGLPHDEWREHQWETIQWVKERQGHLLVEAPTGSGKTSIAAALSVDRHVMTLVKTKNLQAVNYGQMYGFDVLYGRGNYPCAMEPVVSAGECPLDEPKRCLASNMCGYQVAKRRGVGRQE